MLGQIGDRGSTPAIELALDQLDEGRPGHLLDPDRRAFEAEEGHRSEALAVFAGDVEDRRSGDQRQQDGMQAARNKEVELAVSGDQIIDGTVEIDKLNVGGGDLPHDLLLE